MKTHKEKKQKSNNIKNRLVKAKAFVLTMFMLTNISMDVFAQTNLEPVMPSNQIPIGKSYNPENPFPNQWNYFPQQKNSLLNINYQTQQMNKQQMEKFGYQPPPTQQQMTVDYYDQHSLSRQQKEKELYKIINDLNNEPRSNSKTSAEFNTLFRLANINSPTFKYHLQHYNSAYNEILEMLSGKKELSLKRTVFLVENSYYQNKLNYAEFCKQVNELVLDCKQILKSKNLNQEDFMACHFAIQQLFKEKFKYDFDDYMGKDDFTKQFVSKLLNINTGQCHSLPLLYLILAEDMNINAFLAFAPNHSYIKFGNAHLSFNFETINGTFVSDKWIVGSGYVSSTAIKNHIYLAPLSKEQVISQCLIDLALGFENFVGKSDFTIRCANSALQYFPNNINSMLIISNYIVAQFANIAKKYDFPEESEYHKYPELKKQFDEVVAYELQVERSGYIKIPPEQYECWQQTANEAKQQEEDLKFSNRLKESVNAN